MGEETANEATDKELVSKIHKLLQLMQLSVSLAIYIYIYT